MFMNLFWILNFKMYVLMDKRTSVPVYSFVSTMDNVLISSYSSNDFHFGAFAVFIYFVKHTSEILEMVRMGQLVLPT